MAPRNPVKWLVFAGLIGSAYPVCASDLNQAAKAVRMQEFNKALSIYRDLANQGDAEAQYQLANFYLQGRAVDKDLKQAQKWLQKSAAQGLPAAQYGLAQLVMERDPEGARALLEKSAAQGYRAAISQLKRSSSTPKKEGKVPFNTQWFGAARNNDTAELERLNQIKPAINLTDEKGRTAIFYAIEANAQKAYIWLKKNGANLNAKDSYGATPLQVAIERRNQAIIKSLLKADVNASTTLKNGDSLLHYALRLEQYELINPLLEAGAPINHRNLEGWTALDLAEYKNAPKTTALLKGKGAQYGDGWRSKLQAQDVQSVAKQLSNSNLPPVAMAIINNNEALLRTLVKKDPNLLSIRLNDDSTLPILAVKHDKPTMLQALIDLGANVLQTGYQGVTPLQVATREKSLRSVDILLGAGASPIQKDEAGRDAIVTAIEYEQLEIANQLIDNLVGQGRSKSEIRVHLKNSDVPVNQYILLATQHLMEPLIDRLLPYSSDELEVDQQERNALWFAAEAGNAQLILKLLKAGVPADHEDALGRTPFIIAVDEGCLECARQLLGFVDINHQTQSGNTALMLAAAKGDALIAAWLIQNKADIEMRNKRGNTAVMEAVNANSSEIVTYLLKADANVTRKNKLGFSAIDLAKQTSPEMLDLVKSKSVLGLF